MKQVNPLIVAAASALAVLVVEALGGAPAPIRALSFAPLVWLSLAAVFGTAFRNSAGTAIVAVVAMLASARAASDRRDFAERAPVSSGVVEGRVDGPIHSGPAGSRFTLATEDRRIAVILEGRPNLQPSDRVSVWVRVATGPSSRNPGGGHASDDRSLRASGHDAVAFARASDLKVIARPSGPSLWRIAARIQTAATRIISVRGGDKDGNAITVALVTGNRAAVDDRLREALRDGGVAHLLAVSGLHLAVVSLFAFGATRRLWALFPLCSARIEPRVAASVFAFASALLYTAVTGARPSSLRALAVLAVVFVAIATFRRPRVKEALGAAATLLLLWRPAILFDASFQMSIAAALVLVLAFKSRAPALPTWFARRLATGRDLILVAALALLATAPTSINLYEQLPIAGLLLNVVAVPLVELVVLPTALVGSLLSPLIPPLGGALIDLSIVVSAAIARLAATTAVVAPPLEVAPLQAAQLMALLGAIVLLILTVRARALGGTKQLVCATASVFLGVAVIVYAVPGATSTPDALTIAFLDVGQGDAAVIEFPGGQVWLVDAGGVPRATRALAESPGRRAIVGYLRHRGIKSIDVAVISHAHPDHYLGLGGVARTIPIRRLLLARDDPDQPRPLELRSLLLWLRVLGTRIEEPPTGIDVGEAKVEFLAPRFEGAVAVDPVSSVNDNSLVLRVEFAGRSALLSGDLEEEGEAIAVAQAAERLDVDVVKVNHHGSKTSSWPSWIDATTPSIAVISCGRNNRYGFPNRGVLARWLASGADVFRTDRDGAVTVTLGPGGRVSARSFVALPGP